MNYMTGNSYSKQLQMKTNNSYQLIKAIFNLLSTKMIIQDYYFI